MEKTETRLEKINYKPINTCAPYGSKTETNNVSYTCTNGLYSSENLINCTKNNRVNEGIGSDWEKDGWTRNIGQAEIDGKNVDPQVTWGTSPQDVAPVNGTVPDPNKEKDIEIMAPNIPSNLGIYLLKLPSPNIFFSIVKAVPKFSKNAVKE